MRLRGSIRQGADQVIRLLFLLSSICSISSVHAIVYYTSRANCINNESVTYDNELTEHYMYTASRHEGFRLFSSDPDSSLGIDFWRAVDEHDVSTNVEWTWRSFAGHFKEGLPLTSVNRGWKVSGLHYYLNEQTEWSGQSGPVYSCDLEDDAAGGGGITP